MRDIVKIFENLKEGPPEKAELIKTEKLPGVKNHKIGCSNTGQPIFLISCTIKGNSKPIDTNLESLKVQYGCRCQVLDKQGNIKEKIYTLISLKPHSEHLHFCFLKSVILIIKNISANPTLTELKHEIDNLIVLFSKFSKPPTKTIQGLWAELLIIETAINPAYLIKSWHNLSSARFDFNDGANKIEVKSTTKERRIHTFSLEQLNQNGFAELIISSVFVAETGLGINVLDLIEKIESRLEDKSLIVRIYEIVAETLGHDFQKSFDIFFDYRSAVNSIQHYFRDDIPVIDFNSIPKNILNVKFDCDLTNINTATKVPGKSNLHDALF
jgi:hypothetical protein